MDHKADIIVNEVKKTKYKFHYAPPHFSIGWDLIYGVSFLRMHWRKKRLRGFENEFNHEKEFKRDTINS